ncbi:Zinc finger protein 211, partial [Galemys pyrenaicus]
CSHEADDEQNNSVPHLSQVRTTKASVSSQKTHPSEMRGPELKDILHWSNYKGAHCGAHCGHRTGACEKQLYFNAKIHTKQHIGGKHFRNNVDNAPFVKDCKISVSEKPLSCGELVRDFLASSRFHQQQFPHTREKLKRTQCGPAISGEKSQYNSGKYSKDFTYKHTLRCRGNTGRSRGLVDPRVAASALPPFPASPGARSGPASLLLRRSWSPGRLPGRRRFGPVPTRRVRESPRVLSLAPLGRRGNYITQQAPRRAAARPSNESAGRGGPSGSSVGGSLASDRRFGPRREGLHGAGGPGSEATPRQAGRAASPPAPRRPRSPMAAAAPRARAEVRPGRGAPPGVRAGCGRLVRAGRRAAAEPVWRSLPRWPRRLRPRGFPEKGVAARARARGSPRPVPRCCWGTAARRRPGPRWGRSSCCLRGAPIRAGLCREGPPFRALSGKRCGNLLQDPCRRGSAWRGGEAGFGGRRTRLQPVGDQNQAVAKAHDSRQPSLLRVFGYCFLHFPALCAPLTVVDCWHGVEDEEVPCEQMISTEGMSQVKTRKADPSPQEAQPFERCDPIARDVLPLAEHQQTCLVQKPYTCRKRSCFAASHQQYQPQYITEMPFRSSVDKTSFIKACTVHVSGKPFNSGEIGKDFIASMELYHQQVTLTREKPNINDCEYENVFHSGRSHHSWEECEKTFSYTDTLELSKPVNTVEGNFFLSPTEDLAQCFHGPVGPGHEQQDRGCL